MGNNQSFLSEGKESRGDLSIPDSHMKIFNDVRSIQNPALKVKMIQTILAGPEYVASAKHAGVYADLLAYIAQYQNGSSSSSSSQPKKTHIQRFEKPNSEQKAIGYFQACLEVLGLEEEVALTENLLKKAYKKATLKNHPDKGGSEKEFEKITRAYAYLGDILRRINGGRTTEGKVEAPNVLQDTRSKEYETVKHVEPIKLNPKKLDTDAFNKMFEQTRIPDPEEDGYGDWLKDEKAQASAPKFSGKFNRDVFNQMFEEDAKSSGNNHQMVHHQPQSMIMAPTLGVELGRERPDTFTAPYSADLNYTDLKQAYTTENTFSKQVANVRVENRTYESYKNDYGKAPPPLSSEEMNRIQEGEQMMAKREQLRQRRAAEELINSDSYFERMKRLVITNN